MGNKGASSGKSGSGAASKSPTEMTNQEIIDTYGEYRYHATTPKSIWGIYDNGLKPNQGHAGKGVYMSPSEIEAVQWAETSTSGKTVLRINTPVLYKQYGFSDIGDGEGLTNSKKAIPSKYIEINVKGTWMNLEKYKQKNQLSYNLYKQKK